MSQPAALYQLGIAGVGMMTSLGCNTAMTLAAVNAGISRYQVSSFYNRHSKPITVAKVPDEALPPLKMTPDLKLLSGREKRLLQISIPAITEAMAHYPFKHPLPLFLAGPEKLCSGAKKIVAATFFNHLVVQGNVNIDLQRSRYFATGRAGVIEAIASAFQFIVDTKMPYVLVGGVDSYLDAATLGYLDVDDRVLAENSSDAFAPGEGAAFILVSTDALSTQSQHAVVISPPGIGSEPGHLYSDEPYLGQGLADAFSSAIQNGNGAKVSTIYSSMNGENYFAKELGVAVLRSKLAFQEDFLHEHPADCLGDIGAATGAVLIALAHQSLVKDKRLTQKLVYCSSDFSNRAAICLAKADVNTKVSG